MKPGYDYGAEFEFGLDLVLDGRAAPELLATYEQERRPSAQRAIDFSIELGRVICVADPAEAAARDEAMAAAVTGEVSEAPGQPGLDSGLLHRDAPMAGEQFPQAQIGGRRFDDVHGAGWRLVTDDPHTGDLAAEAVERLASIGGTVIAVGDTAPELSDWFVGHGVHWALQRPDFHLYGTAEDAAAAAELVNHLHRQLAGASIATEPRP
ncbi:MAG: hypothetical protein ACK4V6_08205 [Microthrixaceae bacterium]